jgi:hypothetical protein
LERILRTGGSATRMVQPSEGVPYGGAVQEERPTAPPSPIGEVASVTTCARCGTPLRCCASPPALATPPDPQIVAAFLSRVAQPEPLRVAHMEPVTGRERIPSIEVHFLRSVAILVMLHLECEVVGGPRIEVEG